MGGARLLREDYCDGLGDCLPARPTGAIRFEEREAPAYDHAAVMAAKAQNAARSPADAPAAVPAASGVKPPRRTAPSPVPPARCPSGRSKSSLLR